MKRDFSPDLKPYFRNLVNFCAWFTIVTGLVSTLIWFFEIPSFLRILPTFANVRLSPAVLTVLIGSSLLGLTSKYRNRVVSVFAWLASFSAFIIAILSLLDQLVFKELLSSMAHWRMAPASAIILGVLAMANLSLFLSPPFKIGVSQFLALLGLSLSTIATLGHILDVTALYQIPFTSMAFHTALALVVLSFGILIARPDQGLMTAFSSKYLGGVIGRRLVLAFAVVLVTVSVLAHVGYSFKFYDFHFVAAFIVAACICIFSAVIWWTAMLLNQTDMKRAEALHLLSLAKAELEKANAELEKRVEERTQELELQSTVVSHMAEGVCLVRVSNGEIVYANPRFHTMFGYNFGELNGKPVAVLNYDDGTGVSQKVAEKIMGSILKEGSYSYEIHNVRKDGTPFWCRASASVFNHPKFGMVFVAVQEDIDEQKRILNAFNESKERLDLALDCSRIGIWEWRFDTNALIWDDAMFELYELDRAQTDPDYTKWSSSLLSEDKERVEMEIIDAFERGREFDTEFRIRTPSEKVKTIRARGKVFRDAQGKPYRMIGANWDISDVKAVQQELIQRNDKIAQTNAELSQFAYVASHDLQSPLRSISVFAQLIAERLKNQSDPQVEDWLARIVSGTKHMNALIRDLLDCARVGSSDVAPQVVDTKQLAQSVVDRLVDRTAKTQVRIDVGDLPCLRIYESRLSHLFQNLLENALKYSRKDGPIEVSIGAIEQSSHWKFWVKDNGIGIDARHFNKIFEMFKRLHSDAEYEGTGIGLSICKKIVELHEGEIWVESEPGKGSTFYFTLSKSLGGKGDIQQEATSAMRQIAV